MTTPAVRRANGTFVPGSQHPHNPKLKDLVHVRKRLQEAVWKATSPQEVIDLLHDLYDIAKDKGEPSHVRISAAREFFDRVIGKPAQQIELSTKNKVNVNIKQVAVIAREMFGLTAVVNGEATPQQIEGAGGSRGGLAALPDAGSDTSFHPAADFALTDNGTGPDGPAPALPEAVDSGPGGGEDRGEG